MDSYQTAELRTRIIDGAVIAVIDGGVAALSATHVAEITGIETTAIEEQFPTRDSMLATVVEHWTGAIGRPLLPIAETEGAVPYLQAVARTYALEPQLMRLLAATLGASTDPAAPAASYYRAIYLRFVTTVHTALARDIELGREPATLRPDRGALQLVALYDGFRMQSLLLPGQDIVIGFDRALSHLRRGWARPERADEQTA